VIDSLRSNQKPIGATSDSASEGLTGLPRPCDRGCKGSLVQIFRLILNNSPPCLPNGSGAPSLATGSSSEGGVLYQRDELPEPALVGKRLRRTLSIRQAPSGRFVVGLEKSYGSQLGCPSTDRFPRRNPPGRRLDRSIGANPSPNKTRRHQNRADPSESRAGRSRPNEVLKTRISSADELDSAHGVPPGLQGIRHG
jgi:hypothetical protein